MKRKKERDGGEAKRKKKFDCVQVEKKCRKIYFV